MYYTVPKLPRTITELTDSLQLKCNGVEIVDYQWSDSEKETCLEYWSRTTVNLKFRTDDTATAGYRVALPGMVIWEFSYATEIKAKIKASQNRWRRQDYLFNIADCTAFPDSWTNTATPSLPIMAGETLSVSCNPGYKNVGDEEVGCGEDGVWTGEPHCLTGMVHAVLSYIVLKSSGSLDILIILWDKDKR